MPRLTKSMQRHGLGDGSMTERRIILRWGFSNRRGRREIFRMTCCWLEKEVRSGRNSPSKEMNLFSASFEQVLSYLWTSSQQAENLFKISRAALIFPPPPHSTALAMKVHNLYVSQLTAIWLFHPILLT